MCSRPTRAATWISWSAAAAPKFPVTPIEPAMKGEIDNPATYPSLRDGVVFVTGGGSGIGRSLVEHFCAQGAQVTFVDIAEDASCWLVDGIVAKGQKPPAYIKCDLRDIEQLRAAVAETQK